MLRRAIAAYVGADEAMVVPGAGADEMILLAAAAWLAPGAPRSAESPTYAMYRIATLQRDARLVEVPTDRPRTGLPG